MDVVPPKDEEAPAGAPVVSSAFDLMLAGGAVVAGANAAQAEVRAAETSLESPRRLALQLESIETTERKSPLEWIALILAVVVAPIGLLLGIIAVVRSSRSRGYVSTLARSAIVVSVVFCLLGAGGAVAGSVLLSRAAQEEALRVSSEPMCAALGERAGILSDPAFGWPQLSTIPAYTADVTAYESYWKNIAAIAPKGVRADASAVATAATAVAQRIATSRVIDHSRDNAELAAVASGSALPAWVSTYCR